jgi:hypothetical protein
MEILDVDERLMYYNEELKEYKEEVWSGVIWLKVGLIGYFLSVWRSKNPRTWPWESVYWPHDILYPQIRRKAAVARSV